MIRNLDQLPGWGTLQTREKQRLMEVTMRTADLEGEASYGKEDKIRAKAEAEKPKTVSTPLNPSGIKFNDYRDEIWGDSYNWSFLRSLATVEKLAIHHSVTIRSASPDDVALLHKARGWGGIGYHFVVTEDGTVYYVGDIGTGRANIANNNQRIIGICLTGDFTRVDPTKEQLASTHDLCEYFITKYPALPQVTGWEDVIGHQEAYKLWSGAEPTACPGSNWKTGSPSFYDQIRNYKSDPVPTPPPATGTSDRVRLEKTGEILRSGRTDSKKVADIKWVMKMP